MVEINWADEAQFWLKDIHGHISLDNPEVAKKVIHEIYQTKDTIDILGVFHGALNIERYL
ncbi:MAG TPA: hypothetical protein EYG82_03695 [Sulfurovum sp.]|nr:hypothetical protein [Sulfurovum sp.]